MKPTSETAFYLRFVFYLLSLFATVTGFGQVTAGITVNGIKKKTGDTIKICKGDIVQYTSSATGVSGTNINWVFENGNPESFTGSGVNILYSNTGVGKTIQHVSDGIKKDSTFIFVKVSDTYTNAGFNFDPATAVCGSESITFTSTSTNNITTYNWDFGDGGAATANPATHAFTSATGNGTSSYNVKLSVTNTLGCTAEATKTMQVKQIPDASLGNADITVMLADFNNTPTFSKCDNLPSYSFSFKNSSATIGTNTGYTIKWGDNNPDSSFTSWNSGIIKHTFLKGNTVLTFIITGTNGCTAIKKYNIFVGTTPKVGLSNLGNSAICEGDSLQFKVNDVADNTPGTFYTFGVSDFTPVQNFPTTPPEYLTHVFNLTSCGQRSEKYSNAFDAVLVAQNSCASATATVEPIYVSGKAKAKVATYPADVACVNSSVTIYNTSDGGGTVSNGVCTQNMVQVWKISPATGYETSSDTGDFNGSFDNPAVWNSGSSSLNMKFTQAGTYTIKMYVSNQNSCGGSIDSTEKIICIRNPPQASFSLSKPSACDDFIMKLQNTSTTGTCTGDIYSWAISPFQSGDCGGSPSYSWVNGSNNSSVSPEVTFTGAGNYKITLTAYAENAGTYGCPSSSYSDTFVIKTKPSITLDALSACINSPIAPTAKVADCYATDSLTYKWEFSSAIPTSSTDSTPTGIVYATAGTYPIKLSATNECGTDTATQTVTVIAQPVADAGKDTALCSGSSTTIGVAAKDGLSYIWSPAIGISDVTSANPTLSLTYNGMAADTIYQFVLTAFGGTDCSSTDTVNVKVKKAPQLTITQSAAAICNGSNMQLTASGADTYLWTPADGLDNTNNAVVTAKPDSTTIYTVAGLLSNGCSAAQDVTVTVSPDAKALFTASKTAGCTEFKLQDVITVSAFPEQNDTYNWFANDVLIGTNTNGAFPGYILTTPGEKVIIKLVATSKWGCKADSMQMEFSAAQSTQAAFTADVQKGCGPLEVNFTNTTGILNNVTFNWDFGNGITSDSTQPNTITFNSSPYNNDTAYHVVLTANDGCNTTTWKDTVFVSAGPGARFGIDSTFGCSPYNFTITNTSLGAPDTYYWDFGDGKKDTTNSAGSFTYSYTTGVLDTFRIQLIAENKCARDTQFTNVIVSPNPIKPQINISGGSSGCAPYVVFLNNNTTGATRYTWNFGDNQPPLITTDNQTTVLHTYGQAGNYTIAVSITNGCSDTTVYTNATVFEKPVAAFDINAASLCQADSVKTSVTNQSADAYRWDWNDGTVSSGTTAMHVYKNAGTYTVTLFADRINNVGIVCSDATQQTVTIIGKPDVQITANNSAVNCAPFNLVASAAGSNNENATWALMDSATGNIINTSNTNTYTYNLEQQGTYQLQLAAANTTGCKDTNTINLTIYTKPVAAFEPFTSSTCAKDTTIHFTNTTTYSGTDATTYHWLVNEQQESTNSNNFEHHFSAGQNTSSTQAFNTWLIASNSIGCSDTAKGSLIMNATAKAAFNVDNAAACVPFYTTISNTSANATSYNWLLSGTPVSTSESPALLLNKPSSAYTIQLVAQNNTCPPDTASFTFTTAAKPAASFTLNDTLGCSSNLHVIPTNTTTGARSYTWIWGDNSANSNSATPLHDYTTSGQFVLQLIADDGKCKDTAMHVVAVETKPATDFAASNTTGCDTLGVQFTNLSTNATNFEWRFGDNTTSTQVNPYKQFPPSAMPYTVTLVAVGNYGCRDSAVKPNYIITIPGPHADFTVYPSTIINEPEYALKFTNTTLDLPNYRYLWDMGDNKRYPLRDIPAYHYKDTGEYTVRLIVNDVNTNCIDTASVLMQIHGIPGWLYVPNAFCPKCMQQDLRTFLPKGRGLKTFDMQIFTTWGQLVYRTTSLDAAGTPNAAWDGTDAKGQAIQQDVYIWKITATFLNGTEWKGMKYPYSSAYKREGTITIVR